MAQHQHIYDVNGYLINCHKMENTLQMSDTKFSDSGLKRLNFMVSITNYNLDVNCYKVLQNIQLHEED